MLLDRIYRFALDSLVELTRHHSDGNLRIAIALGVWSVTLCKLARNNVGPEKTPNVALRLSSSLPRLQLLSRMKISKEEVEISLSPSKAADTW